MFPDHPPQVQRSMAMAATIFERRGDSRGSPKNDHRFIEDYAAQGSLADLLAGSRHVPVIPQKHAISHRRAFYSSSPSPPSSSPPRSPPRSSSSTASSNSGPPNSSPISRPILRISRATLLGSFSSTSPSAEGSLRASSRASSLRGVANRDIKRRSLRLPQCWQISSTASLMRRVRMLERLRH